MGSFCEDSGTINSTCIDRGVGTCTDCANGCGDGLCLPGNVTGNETVIETGDLPTARPNFNLWNWLKNLFNR